VTYGQEPGPPPGYQPGQPPGWGPGYYYPPPRTGPSGSAIALTVVSALLTMSCYFTLAGLPSLVFAIISLVRAESDPEGSRRMATVGWIVMGAVSAVVVVLIVAGLIALFAFGLESSDLGSGTGSPSV
jgi:hypothetical protein